MAGATREFENQYKASISVLEDAGLDLDDYEVAIRFTKEFRDEKREFIEGLVGIVNKPVLIEMWEERFFYFVLKFEFNFVDALDKASALSTVQIDVENAERYDINYTDADGSLKRPIILHCSPSGAIERLIFALLEKAHRVSQEGKVPMLATWISPTQVRVIPVSERHLARAEEVTRAAVGMAAINSLLDAPDRLEERHAVDVILDYGRDREVTLVGHFPFADRLREGVRQLHVLELYPREGDLPASAAARVIPRSDVVAITASTLVNHTFDGLLALASGRPVILIGPTAPLAPVLLAHGVTALCGSVVTDPDAALRALSEGVGFRRLPGLRRVVLRGGA